jgi:AsmA family protein
MTFAAIDRRVPVSVKWIGGVVFGLVLAVALLLSFANWNMLRGPIGRYASMVTGRTIVLGGDLKVHPWSFSPEADIGGLKIGNPKGVPGWMADIPEARVRVKLLPLLVGHWNLPLLDLEKPTFWLFVDKNGQGSWHSAKTNGQPTKLPPIEHFIINNGRLGFVDLPRKLRVSGVLQSSETEGRKVGGSFSLIGRGTENGHPFQLSISGDPLLNLKPNQPYGFDSDIRAADTHIVINGVLSKPFDFGQVKAAMMVSGRDFADLYDLTGLALPNTPPYRLSGDLARNGTSYSFTHVHGRVGESDLAGAFKVDRIDNRPNLKADLHSHSLNFFDLGSLVGAPKPGAGTALDKAQAAQRRAEGRLMPDATLNVARVRSTDATLHYTADQVTAQGSLPLSHVLLDLKLDHGVLTMSPLNFSLPRGLVTSKIRIDARTDQPKDDVDVRVTNAHLEDFFKASANAPLQGMLEARAQLHGVGDSVHKAASTADGAVALAVPSGKLRKLFAEGLGIDVANALSLYLSKNQSDTGVRCAIADFSSSHGMLTARNVVLDADHVQARGTGDVNLATETLNLSLTGEPKRLRIGRVMAPITLTGQLRSPKIGVKAGKAPAQAGIAVALGVALGPLAAVLPFIDPGLAKNADCAGLLTEARATGAPVKASAIANAAPGGKK